MKKTVKCSNFHRSVPNIHFKQYRQLGKSIPNSKRVYKKSTEKGGIQLSTVKKPKIEIYNEAIEHMSQTKKTIMNKPGLDMPLVESSISVKENLKKIQNDQLLPGGRERSGKKLIAIDDGDDTEIIDNLNDSFGNPKTRRTVKMYQDQLINNCNHLIYIAANDVVSSALPSKNYQMLSSTQVHSSNLPDSRLEFALYTLDLSSLLPMLKANLISFYDMLLLSKEDLLELKIPMGYRNRILAFAEEYRKFGREFTLEEINDFFIINKSFVFAQGRADEKLNVNAVINGYENAVMSTANFNNEQGKTSCNTIINPNTTKKLGITCDNEVFAPVNKPKSSTPQGNCKVKIENYTESQEELDQIPQKDPSKAKLEEKAPNIEDDPYFYSTNTQGFHSTNKTCPTRCRRRIGRKKAKSKKKANIIINEYNTISTQVDAYFINYKTQKEKSVDRFNRIKCFIKKCQRSKSKPKHSVEEYIADDNNNTGKLCGFNYPNRNRISSIGGGMNLNIDDLEVEEERNLHEELNKILNRINSASKLAMDRKSLQQLNRIKSMADLRCRQENEGKLKLMDLNVINKVRG